MVGIVEEQHPERARLFMQWKQMEWPILVDAQNLLKVPYVPITLGIDEHGIVRYLNPPFATATRLDTEFLDRTYEAPAPSTDADGSSSSASDTDDETAGDDDARTRAARAYLERDYDGAVRAYEQIVREAPHDGWSHFRLGVSLRSRFESELRQPDDFQTAVSAWEQALQIDPNNYIWRRRIQQYGPRLDKPYPFYDWIHEARADIEARGETPLPLQVEPRGTEFAGPAGSSGSSDSSSAHADPDHAGTAAHPDPEARISRDTEFIDIRPTLVAHSSGVGKGLRVHLEMTPSGSAHWNNEVEGVQVWLEAPAGWRLDAPLVTLENPPAAESREARFAEFDLRPVEGAGTGPASTQAGSLRGFALYYICEDKGGVCLYRRQDFAIDLP